MPFPLRLVATDADGTLLAPDGRATERTRRALAAVAAGGAEVAVVTGRPWVLTRELAEQVGARWAVCLNGTQIVEVPTGRVIVDRLVPPELSVRAARGIRPLGVSIGVEMGDDTFHWEAVFAEVLPLLPPGPPADDAIGRIDGPVRKLFVHHDELDLEDLIAAIGPMLPDGLAAAFAGLPFVEVGAPTDKGRALHDLCAHLGIATTDVIAFGDAVNDHRMLISAGHSVAMGNADAATAALADEVAPSNADDGVAVVLERLLDDAAAGG